MLEKDYFMRLIQTLLDAIQNIVNSIDKEDVEGAKKRLNESYGFLGKDADFFITSSIGNIIIFFKTKEGDYLKRAEVLAELLFLNAEIQTSLSDKKQLLNKSKLLFEYYTKYSKEYSFTVNSKLVEINDKLNF
jgi:hypothetical protein